MRICDYTPTIDRASLKTMPVISDLGKKVSIIVPSVNEHYLPYLISSLERQTRKPYELIIVAKGFDPKLAEGLCSGLDFKSIVIEQREGAFTQALNIGKSEAKGDLLIFADDDIIAPPEWVETYIMLHEFYGSRVACVSSRERYYDLLTATVKHSPDEKIRVRLYREVIRPWFGTPHRLLGMYKLGVYLTSNLNVAVGKNVPHKQCYSFPLRGANMSFKHDAISNLKFPEHPLLKKAPGNEQHLGLQLFLKGYQMIFSPENPVLHIMHESLSRHQKKTEIKHESEIMRSLYSNLLKENHLIL